MFSCHLKQRHIFISDQVFSISPIGHLFAAPTCDLPEKLIWGRDRWSNWVIDAFDTEWHKILQQGRVRVKNDQNWQRSCHQECCQYYKVSVNLNFQKRIQKNLISDWISRSTNRSKDNPFVSIICHVGNYCVNSEIAQSCTPKDDSLVELMCDGEIWHFSKLFGFPTRRKLTESVFLSNSLVLLRDLPESHLPNASLCHELHQSFSTKQLSYYLFFAWILLYAPLFMIRLLNIIPSPMLRSSGSERSCCWWRRSRFATSPRGSTAFDGSLDRWVLSVVSKAGLWSFVVLNNVCY
jgi:hypothetical protein